MSTISSSLQSHPDIPEDGSRGSSVSSGFVNEYEEILKYAIVAPKLQIVNNPQPLQYDKPKPVRNEDGPSPFSTSATSSSSSSSSSSSAASSPSEDMEKCKTSGELEVKIIHARKAVQKKKDTAKNSFGSEKKLRFIDTNSKAMETLLETPKDSGCSTNKIPCANESSESLVGELPSPSIDKDLLRMDSALDDWCLQLKRNVLNEMADMKKRQLQYEENSIEQLKSKHNAEMLRLTHEVESLKELLYTFEQNVKQKDEVIINLTNVLNKQKEKSEKLRLFSLWRLKHNDEKRNVFALKMAEKFYKRTLITKTWIAWRSVVESSWKKRVEKACQIKSQEICLQLTQDYEERLQGLQNELSDARTEVAKMHTERECYEENMKKAFMRGVCALNMEAMSMFKEEQPTTESHTLESTNRIPYPSTTQPTAEKYITTNNTSSLEAPPSFFSQSNSNDSSQKKNVRFHEHVQQAAMSKKSTAHQHQTTTRNKNASNNTATSNRKNVNVKMTGKKDYGALRKSLGSQSSAISSIKVERHMPNSPSQNSIQSQSIPSLACTQSEVNPPTGASMGGCGIACKPLKTSVIVD